MPKRVRSAASKLNPLRSTTMRQLLIDGLGSTIFAGALILFSLTSSQMNLAAFCLVGAVVLQMTLGYRTYHTVRDELSQQRQVGTGVELAGNDFCRLLHVATAASLIVALGCALVVLNLMA